MEPASKAEQVDQFVIHPMSMSSMRLAMLWLEVSMMIVQCAVFALVLLAIPLWRMLPRVSLSKWWALSAAFPPAAIILIWVVGFRPWNQQGESSNG